jgi:hypothetical protein
MTLVRIILEARFILSFSSISYQEELLLEGVFPDLPVVRFNLRLNLLFIICSRLSLDFTELTLSGGAGKQVFIQAIKMSWRNQTVEEQFVLENESHEVGSCFSSV